MKHLASVMLVNVVICRALAQGFATGMAISEQHVLTAYDVVGNQRGVQLKFGEEAWQTAEYVDGDSDEGWCLLRLSGKAPAFVTVESKKKAEAGERGVGIRHSVRVDKSSIGAGLFSEEGNHAIGLIVGAQGRPDRCALSLYERTSKIRQYLGPQDTVNRRSNRKAVCVIQSASVEATVSGRRVSRSSSSNDTNTETYQKCKNSVATVESDEGGNAAFYSIGVGKGD